MPLSEKNRSELFAYFEPRLGVGTTAARLSEFPRSSGQELVTKDYLDLRLDALAGDLRSGIMGQVTTLVVSATTVVLAALAIATTIVIAAN